MTGIVTRENPIRRATCDPAGAGFDRIVEIRPDPDSRIGYPSIPSFQTVNKAIRQIWGSQDVVVSAGLMVASTDTKHYLQLSPNVYRFSPTFMYPDDVPRFHGNNERISIKNYGQAVNYYSHLMTNADRKTLPAAAHEAHSADL